MILGLCRSFGLGVLTPVFIGGLAVTAGFAIAKAISVDPCKLSSSKYTGYRLYVPMSCPSAKI